MAEYLPSWAVPSTSTFPYYLNIQKSNKIIDQISLISPQNSSSTTPSSSSILFGRHKECNIILDHSSISRKHALIFFDNQNNSYLIDLNSSHGTKINQQNLTPFQYYQLHENDIIEFGQSSRQYIYCKHDITSNTISTPTTSSSSRPVVPLFHEDVKDDNTQSQQSIEIISGDEYEKREKILSKEEERKLRQQEIAAYALEMSSTVPIFNSTRSTLTKEDLAQVAQVMSLIILFLS